MRAMFDAQMSLLTTVLQHVVAAHAAGDGEADAWEAARQALAPTRASEPELAAIVDAKDAGALKLLVAQWTGGQRPLPVQDREVLKRAMTAFRKSLKVTRLHDESGLTPNAMTSGRHSTIQGIMPPPRYPPEVWQELARQRRLIAAKHGIYELPPE